MSDTLVCCTECNREERVGFASSLSGGWPKCCGYTMRLIRTDADVEASTREAIDDQVTPLLRRWEGSE